MTVPALFSNNVRSNRSLEALGRNAQATQTLTGVEQATTVDGPAGTSATVPTVSRWQSYDAAMSPGAQFAYVVEPAHATPVGVGSGLPDLSFAPDGTLLALERSEAASEFLARIFAADLSAATDVSQPPLDDGIDPNEAYTPPAKTLLLSDDRFGKLEDLAAGPLICGEQVLLGVEDGNDASPNVIRSFLLPEPGALLQLAAGALCLAGLARTRSARTAGRRKPRSDNAKEISL